MQKKGGTGVMIAFTVRQRLRFQMKGIFVLLLCCATSAHTQAPPAKAKGNIITLLPSKPNAVHPVYLRLSRTALVVIDMWPQPLCSGARTWADNLATNIGKFMELARSSGVTIVHAPSTGSRGAIYARDNLMGRYASHREMILGQRIIPRESIDPNADNGPAVCGNPGCRKHFYQPSPLPKCLDPGVGRENEILEKQLDELRNNDALTDDLDPEGALFNAFLDRKGIDTLLYVGVAVDQCVWSRPAGIRRMLAYRKRVLLVSDLVDVAWQENPTPEVKQTRKQYKGSAVLEIEKQSLGSITREQFERALKHRHETTLAGAASQAAHR
jgi:nicotinamidase-related amidase